MIQIITTIITSVCTMVGVVIATVATSKKSSAEVQTRLAVMDNRIEELTREVRIHNNFAQRVPVCENDIAEIKRRVGELEKGE